jgi:rubredoxin
VAATTGSARAGSTRCPVCGATKMNFMSFAAVMGGFR